MLAALGIKEFKERGCEGLMLLADRENGTGGWGELEHPGKSGKNGEQGSWRKNSNKTRHESGCSIQIVTIQRGVTERRRREERPQVASDMPRAPLWLRLQ